MASRIDDFRGTQGEYISYLEANVVSLRSQSHCHQCSPSVSKTPKGPEAGHALSGGSRQLKFVQIDVAEEWVRQETGPRKKPKAEVPRWKSHALKLVAETPNGMGWMHRLKETGIAEVMCDGKAVSHLLLLESGDRQNAINCIGSPTREIVQSSPLARIEQYARVSAVRGMAAAVATTLARYQQFLVLSACTVLKTMGNSDRRVFDIVAVCMGRPMTDEHCRRLLQGCRFVHELMDSLHMGGWGLRAFELLLVWNKTPTFYCTIAYSYKPALEFLQGELLRSELTTGVETQSPNWMFIFAPKLVQDLLGDGTELAQIATILGYRYPAFFETRVNAWDYIGSTTEH